MSEGRGKGGKVVWRGEAVKKKLVTAAIRGVNITMSGAVLRATYNHPGWKNITSVAEGSIRIVENAKLKGKRVAGLWGSRNVGYMVFLEFLHGAALRSAADIEHPKLKRNIAAAMSV